MVGALADWFAVTALFRHPLGLPIPHTAIIPNRKDALGAEPAGVRERRTSCTEDVARDRVAAADVARRARSLAGGRAATAPGSWPRWRPRPRRRCAPLHQDEVRSPGRGVHAAAARRGAAQPGRRRLLEEIVRDGAHHGLVDLGRRRGSRVARRATPSTFAG